MRAPARWDGRASGRGRGGARPGSLDRPSVTMWYAHERPRGEVHQLDAAELDTSQCRRRHRRLPAELISSKSSRPSKSRGTDGAVTVDLNEHVRGLVARDQASNARRSAARFRARLSTGSRRMDGLTCPGAEPTPGSRSALGRATGSRAAAARPAPAAGRSWPLALGCARQRPIVGCRKDVLMPTRAVSWRRPCATPPDGRQRVEPRRKGSSRQRR